MLWALAMVGVGQGPCPQGAQCIYLAKQARMAALVNGTKGINIRNCSGLVEAAERNYQLPKGRCGVTAGEGWTGLPCGANCISVCSCLLSFWAKEAIRSTSPGMSEAKPSAGFSLPVNASLLIYLFLLVPAAWKLLFKLQELNCLGSNLDSLFPDV